MFRGGFMAGNVCIGALAAFGLLCVLWLIYGSCCGKTEGALLVVSRGGRGLVRQCLWLREMGLLTCPMVLIDPELDELDAHWAIARGVEIWRTSRFGEAEDIGERTYGAGTGDPTGRHQRGGVSEL